MLKICDKDIRNKRKEKNKEVNRNQNRFKARKRVEMRTCQNQAKQM